MITAEQISRLEDAGGHRWQKGGYDRIYFNATDLGLDVEYYGTGNVRCAAYDGKSISNAEARRVMSSKMYVNVDDGSVFAVFGRIADDIEESLRGKLNAIVETTK